MVVSAESNAIVRSNGIGYAAYFSFPAVLKMMIAHSENGLEHRSELLDAGPKDEDLQAVTYLTPLMLALSRYK